MGFAKEQIGTTLPIPTFGNLDCAEMQKIKTKTWTNQKTKARNNTNNQVLNKALKD